MKIRLIGAILAILLAVAGSVLLVNYVRTADQRAADGAEFVRAYIIETQVPVGTPAEELDEYLMIDEIPAIAAVPGRVADLSELDGLIAEVDLMPGEQLLTSRWVSASEANARGDVPVPEGMQSVTIALPVERAVGGKVRAGDTVGVLISSQGEDATTGAPSLRTTQTFHKVLVLAVQPGSAFVPSAPDGAETTADPVDVLMITLARSTPDVEVLIWGQEWGKIWLTLENGTATTDGGRVVTDSIVFP